MAGFYFFLAKRVSVCLSLAGASLLFRLVFPPLLYLFFQIPELFSIVLYFCARGAKTGLFSLYASAVF